MQEHWRNQHIIFTEVLVRDCEKFTLLVQCLLLTGDNSSNFRSTCLNMWTQHVYSKYRSEISGEDDTHSKQQHQNGKSLQIFDAITDGEKENTGYFIHAVELLIQMGISTGIIGMLKNLKGRQIRLSLKDKPLG